MFAVFSFCFESAALCSSLMMYPSVLVSFLSIFFWLVFHHFSHIFFQYFQRNGISFSFLFLFFFFSFLLFFFSPFSRTNRSIFIVFVRSWHSYFLNWKRRRCSHCAHGHCSRCNCRSHCSRGIYIIIMYPTPFYTRRHSTRSVTYRTPFYALYEVFGAILRDL